MKNENKVAFWLAVIIGTLFGIIMVFPLFSHAYTEDEVKCDCVKFMQWRGFQVEKAMELSRFIVGMPQVGRVAGFYFPELGYGHVAEIVFVGPDYFITMGANEGGCQITLRKIPFMNRYYIGML